MKIDTQPISSSALSEVLKKTALFIISLGVSLLAGELFIRTFYPQQLIQMHHIYRPDPEMGWRHAESVRSVVNTGEHPVLWATDAQGFRISPYPEEKQNPPRISILMIGDSFVEALAVDYKKTMPYLVQQALEKKYAVPARVVNAGVGSWEPGQYFLQTRRTLKLGRYDLGLVFLYMENDFIDQLRFHFDPLQLEPTKELTFPKEFQWEAFIKDVLYPINNFLEERSHLFVFFKQRSQFFLAKLGLTAYYFPDIFYLKEKNSVKWDVTAAMAERIYQEFQDSHVPSLFILLPTDYQVYPQLFTKYIKMFDISPASVDLEQPNQRLAACLRRRSVPFLDMLPIFRSKAEKGLKLYGLIDNHLNANGQAAAAEAIFPWIEDSLKSKLVLNYGN